MAHRDKATGAVGAKPLDTRTAQHPSNVRQQVIFPALRLTDAQAEVLTMLLEQPQPTTHEMAARLGITVSAVRDRLLLLEKKAAIRTRRVRGSGRTIAVLRACAAWPAQITTVTAGAQIARVW